MVTAEKRRLPYLFTRLGVAPQDGRRELRFGQVEFLQKLAILIPPPHKNLTRYFGVFAPAHRYRADVVAMGREPAALDQEPASTDASPLRKRALPWAELLRRVFAIDILKCDQCGGDMKIIAIIPASEATEAILDHLGIDTHHNPATGPPAPLKRGVGPSGAGGHRRRAGAPLRLAHSWAKISRRNVAL